MPHCDLVVSHGDSGSVLGALKYGLLPTGADQPLNATRCEALNIGLTLDVMSATADEIRGAVSSVMSEPTYRLAAQRLRYEWLALPSIEFVVGLLEQLGKEKRPLYS